MTQSSYLMVFIRNLMENSSKDVREKKKRQLESDFNQTGAVLTKCLTEYFDDVNKILTMYNAVSKRISANKDAVGKVKRDLIDCKSLLSCNREELRRLWLELVEQRHCIELIDKVDRFYSAPEAISTLVAARAWPEATELILYATELIKKDIPLITTLQPVISELSQKCKIIVDRLTSQLNKLLFDKPVAIVFEKYKKPLKNKKTTRDEDCPDSFIQSTRHYIDLPLNDWSTVTVEQPIADSNLCKEPQVVAASIASSRAAGMRNLTNCEKFDSYGVWVQEVVAVVHCLARLDRLPKILAAWAPQADFAAMQLRYNSTYICSFSGQFQPGEGLLTDIHRFIILQLVDEVESRAIAQGDASPSSPSTSVRYLAMLCQLVFDALFMQTRACLIAIRAMKTSNVLPTKSFNENDGLTGAYVWRCVQHEIQTLLSAHLDEKVSVKQHFSALTNDNNAIDTSQLDLNALLGRRRHGFTISGTAAANASMTGSVSGGLAAAGKSETGSGTNPTQPGSSDAKTTTGAESFSFSNTSHFLSVSTYMREKRIHTDFPTPSARVEHKSAAGTEFPLVCLPRRDNILSVYKQLLEFICAVEHELEAHTEFAPRKSLSVRSKPYCQLRSYLNDFIKDTYLPETSRNLRSKLQACMSGRDAVYTTVSQQVERNLNVNRPLLAVVLCVDECLGEVKRIILAISEYTEVFLKMATNLLSEFIAAMWQAYRSLGEIDGSKVPSSEWAQDDDVSRFWKEFPVWQRLAAHEARLMANNALLNSHKFGDNRVSHDMQNGGGDDGTKPESKQSSHITPITAVVLGLYNDLDGCRSVLDSHLNSRLAIPFSFATGNKADPELDGRSGYRGLSGLLVEREATRLAAKETNQLFHMINDELPDDQPNQSRQLPTVRDILSIKKLGRLSESLSWLSRSILNLDTWLQSGSVGARFNQNRRDVRKTDSPFATFAKELIRLSESCLLMIYLEVRIQVFNHFGNSPSKVTYEAPADDVDVDSFVLDCLAYLQEVQDMLVHTIGKHKFRFIFDGLGDFISQLLLRLIRNINRMNANGNRKMCRNVYRLQQALTSLTETHESDLIRVKQLYELYHLSPEGVVDRLIEQGVAFEESVYRDLLELYQRSHPTHLSFRTDESLARLSAVINGSL